MFGRQKISSAVDNLDKFFDITDRSLIVFEEGVKNYIYHNTDALGGNDSIEEQKRSWERLKEKVEKVAGETSY